MDQDYHNQSRPDQYTPKTPSNPIKSHIPLSQSKGNIKLDLSCKNRFSTRKSIRWRIAQLIESKRFVVIFKGKMLRGHGDRDEDGNIMGYRNGNVEEKINLEELDTTFQELKQCIQRNDEQLELLVNICIGKVQCLTIIKRSSEQFRQQFLNIRSHNRNFTPIKNQSLQNLLYLKKYIDDIHYSTKQQLFKIGSRQIQCKDTLEANQSQFEKKQALITQKLCQYQSITLQVKKLQMCLKDLQSQKAAVLKQLHSAQKKQQKQLSQLFILRMQINCNFFFGFMACEAGIDKRLILRKEFVNWDRAKQRKVTAIDLRRWVLLQLFQGWRGVLRKLGYTASQYQVMFGEIVNQPVWHNLMRTLQHQSKRVNTKKANKLISIHTDLKKTTKYKQQLIEQLQMFSNGIITIQSIQFSPTVAPQLLPQSQPLPLADSPPTDSLTSQTMHIHYTSLLSQQPRLTQKFTIEQGPINRQRLLRDMKGGDRVFCVVQVPLIAHKENIGRYEEIWEMLRKKKGPGGAGAGGLGKAKGKSSSSLSK